MDGQATYRVYCRHVPDKTEKNDDFKLNLVTRCIYRLMINGLDLYRHIYQYLNNKLDDLLQLDKMLFLATIAY